MATARELSQEIIKPKVSKFVKGYAFSLTRNPYDADDLAQETTLRALQSAHLFELGTNLEAWLATIMRNIFFSIKNRNKVSPIDSIPEADYAVELDPNAGLELERVAQVLEKHVNKDIVGILLARVVDGLSEKEISENFNIPVGTVKSRISRARETLREKLLNA